jgi:hypothetical protein
MTLKNVYPTFIDLLIFKKHLTSYMNIKNQEM